MASLLVLSANIRKDEASDGINAWEHRREYCCSTLSATKADLIGIQEARWWQRDDLAAALPFYAWYGLIRTPNDRNPANLIGWNKARFKALSSGGYWLSDTPHIPGSATWGNSSVRLVNWVLLEERRTGNRVRFLNTHLDHESEQTRQNSIRLICDEAMHWPNDLPQILTADANLSVGHPDLAHFDSNGWRDAWRESTSSEPVYTFHDFMGSTYQGTEGRIDFIWHKGPITSTAAGIIDRVDPLTGRWASDHHFISARLARTTM